MNMSDKELDQLFQSKLDNLEEEPSAGLWAHVHHQLDSKVKRRKLAWFYRITASIILVGFAAWLFIPESVPSQAVVSMPKAMPLPEAKIDSKNQLTTLDKEEKKRVITQEAPAKKTGYPSKKRQQAVPTASAVAVAKPSDAVMEEPDTRAFYPEIPDLPLAVAVLPVEKIPAPVLDESKESDAINIYKSVVEKNQTKVRNLGDLLNLMIAKVDKREDKIIEFNYDDGESNISGINLGIVRIKKEK